MVYLDFCKVNYSSFLTSILLLPLISSIYDFKKHEIQLAMEILKELKIFHCAFVLENPKSIILNHKEIYDHDIFVAHVQINNLYLFLNNTQSLDMKTGFVLKNHVNAVETLKVMFKKDPVKVAKFTWIIFAKENIGRAFIIPYDCSFLIAEESRENVYLIKGIYYVKFNGPFETSFGVWSNTTGLVINDKFSEQRKDMRGVALVRGDSYGYVKGTTCNNFTIENLHREIWVEYARLLNFSLVVVTEGLSTEEISPDGSPCASVQHALNYLPDAVFPTCFTPLYMVIKFESDLGEGWKAYLKPFDNDIWFSLLAFIILSAAAFKIIDHFTMTMFHMNPFAVFYSFCCQDGMDAKNERIIHLSSSIAYFMPYVAATVIVPAYSAAILAKLTVQLPKVPFTNLETFARDGTYKIGSLNKTFVNIYFSRSQHPLISKIYKKMYMSEDEHPNIESEAVTILCKGKRYAFIPYKLEDFEKISSCKLFKIPQLVLHLYCGFRMKDKSPFRHTFGKLLIGLYASGMLRRSKGSMQKEPAETGEETFESIEINQVLPILNLIPIGMVLSLIFLILETYKRKTKLEKKIIN